MTDSFEPDIPGAKVVPSPRFWSGRRDDLPVKAVVQHYTASQSEDALVRWMAKHSKVSTHLVIHRDGRVTQMVRFKDRAFHAGEVSGKGFWPAGTPQPANVNHFSIGIENSNAGWLLLDDDSGMFYMPKLVNGQWEKGVLYHGPNPEMDLDHHGEMRFWEPYTDAQVEKNILCLKKIVDIYPDIGPNDVGRHSDVSPHRKWDPGPSWPHEYVISEVFGTSDGLVPVPPTVGVSESSDSADDFIGFDDTRGDNMCWEPGDPSDHEDDIEQMSMIKPLKQGD